VRIGDQMVTCQRRCARTTKTGSYAPT
jgi:hypothetical protein